MRTYHKTIPNSACNIQWEAFAEGSHEPIQLVEFSMRGWQQVPDTVREITQVASYAQTDQGCCVLTTAHTIGCEHISVK
jgi:hypothetical protein